jgi:plasmid stabilization system protein ParE
VIPVAWHPLARRELFEASGFYDKESKGLGDIFLDEVQEALGHLKRHPRLGRELLPQVRRFLVSRFPYSLIYRIETDRRRSRIFILAVAHQKRRPRYWTRRV